MRNMDFRVILAPLSGFSPEVLNGVGAPAPTTVVTLPWKRGCELHVNRSTGVQTFPSSRLTHAQARESDLPTPQQAHLHDAELQADLCNVADPPPRQRKHAAFSVDHGLLVDDLELDGCHWHCAGCRKSHSKLPAMELSMLLCLPSFSHVSEGTSISLRCNYVRAPLLADLLFVLDLVAVEAFPLAVLIDSRWCPCPHCPCACLCFCLCICQYAYVCLCLATLHSPARALGLWPLWFWRCRRHRSAARQQ